MVVSVREVAVGLGLSALATRGSFLGGHQNPAWKARRTSAEDRDPGG